MKLEFGKIKENLLRSLKKFWQKLWLLLILLLILDLILGGVFFWKYYLQVREKESPIIFPLKINQALMEKVSTEWLKREIIFEEAEEKEYLDPFRGTPLEEIEID